MRLTNGRHEADNRQTWAEAPRVVGTLTAVDWPVIPLDRWKYPCRPLGRSTDAVWPSGRPRWPRWLDRPERRCEQTGRNKAVKRAAGRDRRHAGGGDMAAADRSTEQWLAEDAAIDPDEASRAMTSFVEDPAGALRDQSSCRLGRISDDTPGCCADHSSTPAGRARPIDPGRDDTDSELNPAG
jgi:hypothetical protein